MSSILGVHHAQVSLAYEVQDLRSWKEMLERIGMEVLNGIPIPGFERFEFRDPFGNRVEFLERMAEHRA